jgi:hypothetical protein
MCMWAIDFFCCFMLVVMILGLVIPVKPTLFTSLKTFGMIEFKYFQSRNVRYLL